jgi:hypothetical protein
MHVSVEGLEALIEEKIAEAFARLQLEDPWYGSEAAAKYLGVKRQRIHDLAYLYRKTGGAQGLRHVQEVEGGRLSFRRSWLDAHMEGRRCAAPLSRDARQSKNWQNAGAKTNGAASRKRPAPDTEEVSLDARSF